MTNQTSVELATVLVAVGLAFSVAYGQAPANPPVPAAPPGAQGQAAAGRGGGGGRGGGLPGATAEQNQAVSDMLATLAAPAAGVTTARNELAMATFADPRNDATIRAAVDKLRAAEFSLATARAEAFAKLQSGPHRLTAAQVTALVNAGGTLPAGRGGGGGGGAGRGVVPPGAGAQPAGPAPAGRGN